MALGLGASGAAHAAVTRGPYLQMSTEQSVVVVWRTDFATAPVVRYGPSWDNLNQREAKDFALKIAEGVEVDGTVKRYARLHSAPVGTRQYEMSLSGLKPNTRYFYAIYDGDEKLAGGDEAHFFMTHPEKGAEAQIRIWAVGDSGKGDEVQKGVYRGALKVLGEERSR